MKRSKIIVIFILVSVAAVLWIPVYHKRVRLPPFLQFSPPPSASTATDGDLHDWSISEIISLDIFNDTPKGDLLALYAGRSLGGLVLRADVLRLEECAVVFLLDTRPGNHYFAILGGETAADEIVVVTSHRAVLVRDGFQIPVPFTVDKFAVEVEIPPVPDSTKYAVVTVVGGEVLDSIPRCGLPARVTGTAKIAFVHHGNQPIRGTDWNGKIGWIGGMIYDPAGEWDHDNGIPDGYFYSLYNHERYGIPMNLELTLSLVVSLQYASRYFNDTIASQFLDRIRKDIASGLIEILGTVHSQQKLPFYPEEVNAWAINVSYDLVKDIIDPWETLGVNPRVAWVPDRTWTNTSNVVVPMAQRYDAVILDDVVLHDFAGSGANPWKIWEIAPLTGGSYNGGLKVFFIDSNFRDRIFDPSYLIGYFSSLANSPDREQVCVYGDDWEKSSGNGFFDNKQDFASMYGETLRQLSAVPWIQAVKLSDILDEGWSVEGTVNIRNATAPYIDPNGYSDEINEYFNWYKDWAAFVPDNLNPRTQYHLSPYSLGEIKDWAIKKVFNTTALGTYPGNLDPNILALARHVFAVTQHETAFGGINAWGQDEALYDWQKRQSDHARHMGIYRLAAEWAYNQTVGTPTTLTVIYRADVDYDDEDETIMYNNKVFAVVEDRGARVLYLFAIQHGRAVSLIGNGYGFYDGVDYHRCDVESGWGDYDDYVHIAPLTDSPVSVVQDTLPFDPDNNYWPTPRSEYDKQRYDNRTYNLVTIGSDYVEFSYGPITAKRISLPFNSYDLVVSYTTTSTVYINNGFTPDALDLFLHGDSINITATSTSYLVENVYSPALIGLTWSSGISVTNYTHNFFIETVEISGSGSFSFNITARPPSPVQIQEAHAVDVAPGSYFTINATIRTLGSGSIDSAILYYSVNNTIYNVTMSGSGETWTGNVTEHVPLGESVIYWIVANDTDGNFRRSLNYTLQLGSPPYPHVTLDGIISSKENYKLVATDPADDAVSGPEWTKLYFTWDSEKLYFAVIDSSPEDHTSWEAYLWIAIDMRSGGATSLSDWRSNIQFSGSHLPDFYVRIQLKGSDGASRIWDGSSWVGSTSAIFLAGKYNDHYSVFEGSIDWSGMNITTASSTFYVMLGVAGSGASTDSSVDTIPYDPASNDSANEWTDVDVLNSDNFASFVWDTDGNKIPDPIPVVVEWMLPKSDATVSGTVQLNFHVTAIQKVLNVSLFVDNESTPVTSEALGVYDVTKILYWDSTTVPNGYHQLMISLGLENGSYYNITRGIYVSNTIMITMNVTLVSPGKLTFYENETNMFTFEINASTPYGAANVSAVIYINRIFYVPNVPKPYNHTYAFAVSIVDGHATLVVPNYGPGMYYVYADITEEGYGLVSHSLLAQFEVLDVVPEPDYTLSIVTAAGMVIGFVAMLGVWAWLQYRREVYPE